MAGYRMFVGLPDVYYYHGAAWDFTAESELRSPFWVSNSKELARRYSGADGVILQFRLKRRVNVFNYCSETQLDKILGFRLRSGTYQTDHHRAIAQALQELEEPPSGYIQKDLFGPHQHDILLLDTSVLELVKVLQIGG